MDDTDGEEIETNTELDLDADIKGKGYSEICGGSAIDMSADIELAKEEWARNGFERS
jgi:hypothetical protein